MLPLKQDGMRGIGRWRPAIIPAMLLVIVCAVPLLAHSQAASDSAADGSLLRRANTAAEDLIKHLGMVRYVEHVSQHKLRANGKSEYQQDAFFDSLMLVHLKEGRMTSEESSEVDRPQFRFEQRPLLTTSGFATMALLLHPYYEQSFRFSLLGEEVVAGQRLQRLQFEHIKGADSPTVLRLRGRDYPVGLSGTAWLDPQTGAVVRVVAALAEPMEDVGLRSLRCDVQYLPVALQQSPEKFWLPVSANVDLETPHQHWRNVHAFSNYRRFSVDVRLGSGATP